MAKIRGMNVSTTAVPITGPTTAVLWKGRRRRRTRGRRRERGKKGGSFDTIVCFIPKVSDILKLWEMCVPQS